MYKNQEFYQHCITTFLWKRLRIRDASLINNILSSQESYHLTTTN